MVSNALAMKGSLAMASHAPRKKNKMTRLGFLMKIKINYIQMEENSLEQKYFFFFSRLSIFPLSGFHT